MKSILVPVDFSDTSINAAHYAAKLALQTKGRVMLLHAYRYPVIYPVDKGMELTDEGIKEINKKELLHIKTIVEREEPLIKVEYMILNGNLSGVINMLSENMRVDLIVMGITGAGVLKEKLIGSNTLDVANNTRIPVIIVPEKCRFKKIEKIGLTTDFKEVVESIPDKTVIKFLEATGARLHVINVDYHHEYATTDTPFQSGLLESMFQFCRPQYHFVEDENIIEGISRCAEEEKMDMLIAVPHKHSLLERIFTESHTKQIIFHSKVPVMVVHE